MPAPPVLLKNDSSLLFMLCDIQERLAPKMADTDVLINAATKLVKASHLFGSTLLVTEQYPKGLGKTVGEIPVIAELNPSRVHVVEKTEFPMVVKETKEIIEKHEQFIVFGCEAHICVLQTVAKLLEMGKTRIFVASDATGSMSIADHADAMATLRQWGVTVLPCDAYLFQLIHGKNDDYFKQVSQIVKDGLAPPPPLGLLVEPKTPTSPQMPATPPCSPALGGSGMGMPLSPGSPQNSDKFVVAS